MAVLGRAALAAWWLVATGCSLLVEEPGDAEPEEAVPDEPDPVQELAQIAVFPGALDLADAELGEASTDTLTVTNEGASAHAIEVVIDAPAAPGAVTVSGDCTALPAGHSCELSVEFLSQSPADVIASIGVFADGEFAASVPVTARALAPMRTLRVTVDQVMGKVFGSASGASLACPGICELQVREGATVTLSAQPVAPNEFWEWTGTGCGGNQPSCSFELDTDGEVRANFFNPGLSVPSNSDP